MKRNNEFRAGMFIVVTLVLLVASIWLLGRERQIFARQERFFTSFDNVKGLSEGAPIRLGGISIGRVARIGFSESPQDARVHVTMLVNEEYLDRIREDARVSIETQGLLGDRFLSISLGEGRAVSAGSHLESHEAGDISEILSRAGTVVNNTVEISENVNAFMKRLESESLDDLNASLQSVRTLLHEIEKGNGFMNKLFYAEKEGDTIINSLAGIAEDINSITNAIKTGDGFLNTLIYGEDGQDLSGAMIKTAESLAKTSDTVQGIAEEIATGKGLAHNLIYAESPEGISAAIEKLHQTAENLEKASRSLANGGGTLGALLVDSQLYDNLVEVTDGAKRSFILRQAIRSSMKDKG